MYCISIFRRPVRNRISTLIRALCACHFFILAILLEGDIRAQCPPDDISVNSQAKLDTLMSNYPDCEYITGNVYISGSISDLSSFGNIKSIAGHLSFGGNTSLNNLNGLNNLTSIGGDFRVINSSLPSLSGLGALTQLGGDFNFQNSHTLQTLEGPGNLSAIGGNLWLLNNDGLTSLSGLEALGSIGGDFRIDDNAVLTSVDALSGLTTVVGNFEITDNPSLAVIDNINALTSSGQIAIWGNSVLTGIHGFDALIHVGGFYTSNSNSILEVIDGTKNIRTVDGGVRFRGNVTSISMGSLETVSGDLDFNTNTITTLVVGDHLTSIGGDLILETGLTDLPDFPLLESIGGMLLIDSRESLEVLDGFNKLTSVGDGQLGWGFDIYDHNKLTAITGLNSLSTITGNFVISECERLSSIEGLQSLRTVGGSFSVVRNDSLLDCSPLCEFLREGTAEGGKSVFRNGPDETSPCWSQDAVELECAFPMTIVDVNPMFYPDEISPETDIRELTVEQIATFDSTRKAIAADGVSEVIFSLIVPEKGSFTIPDMIEGLETPWGDTAHLIDGTHYIYMLYTPPDDFDSEGTTYRISNEVETYDEEIKINFTGEEETCSLTELVPIVRPPVVLVHGTYSHPDSTWKKSVAGGETMFDFLTNAGLKVFAVNYSESNGSENNSSFEDNMKVVWGDVYATNTGGIKDALFYYRDTLEVATTQADVVGHSLGGVLPRVYASEYYHPDYKRAENFMEGDINRIITLASTHYGSHLGELQVFLEDASPFDLGFLDWIAAQAQVFIASWFSGTSATAAVRDQLPLPGNEALTQIGRTSVPSHAITCNVPFGRLKDAVHDPNEEYYDLYWYITLLMYHNDDLRNLYLDHKLDLVAKGYKASTTLDGGNPQELFPGYNDIIFFKDMINDGLYYTGQVLSIMDGTFELPSDIEILHYALSETGMGDVADPLLSIYQFGTDPAGVATDYFVDALMPDGPAALNSYLSVYDENMEAIRALIFNNDANDGVVRVESQSGKLEDECADCVTNLDNVLHSFAPGYSNVQATVLELLKGDMELFHEEGFPPIDEAQLLYYPERVLSLLKVPRTGPAAICQSGMAPEHARAFAKVADAQNTIIIVRPVNPDGTELIINGAATKEMDVKPKSSNWGPQKGYLASRQRYSKLWKVFEGAKRDEIISKYDMKVLENLTSGITVERHLQVNLCTESYWAYVDEYKNSGINDQSAEDEIVLVPIQDPSQVCTWGPKFSSDMIITDCVPISNEHFLTPLMVMATPRVFEQDGVTPRYLTADYDLLMIGFFEGEGQGPPDPPNVPFMDGVGQITPAQQYLVELLNDAVENTGYDGGSVTHHGPENQFSASPYIDYPVTVFAPDDIPNGFFSGSTNGKILSIDMGPPGFRDIHLKRFINSMRQEGYDLYHNPEAPGWHWQWEDDVPGYQLEDSKDIVDYVEQLPQNDCDKSGAQLNSVCPPVIIAAKSPEELDGWLGRNPSQSTVLSLAPNPVMGNQLYMTMHSVVDGTIQCVITDAIGNRRHLVEIDALNGWSNHVLDVSGLESGIYTVTILPGNANARFVKQ